MPGKILKIDPVNTKLVLTGANGKFFTYANSDGEFRFAAVPDGSYLLEVYDLVHHYDPVLVEVSHQKDVKARGFLYDIKIGKGRKLANPMVLAPSKQLAYFEQKEPFNPISYLKNPMVIMMLVSGGLYFMMKRMPKPDAEQMEEMKKMGGGMPKIPGIFG